MTTIALPVRADILGVYASDPRITTCSRVAVTFTDGTFLGAASSVHPFRLFGLDHRIDMSRSWPTIGDALADLLGAPMPPLYPCVTCGGPLRSLLDQCSKPCCLDVQTAAEKRADRWAER
jgi:hypothetical protein